MWPLPAVESLTGSGADSFCGSGMGAAVGDTGCFSSLATLGDALVLESSVSVFPASTALSIGAGFFDTGLVLAPVGTDAALESADALVADRIVVLVDLFRAGDFPFWVAGFLPPVLRLTVMLESVWLDALSDYVSLSCMLSIFRFYQTICGLGDQA